MIDKAQQTKMRALILGIEVSKHVPASYSDAECDLCGWLMVKVLDEIWAMRNSDDMVKRLYN